MTPELRAALEEAVEQHLSRRLSWLDAIEPVVDDAIGRARDEGVSAAFIIAAAMVRNEANSGG